MRVPARATNSVVIGPFVTIGSCLFVLLRGRSAWLIRLVEARRARGVRPDAHDRLRWITTSSSMKVLGGPKRLVVYQDSRHSVGNVPATNLGPFPPTLTADWMAATLDGRAFPSEKWYVEASGRVVKTAL